MENFRFETNLQHYSGTTRPTDIQLCLLVHRQKSAVIKSLQLLSKVPCINGKSLFDQLATASSSTSP